MCELNKLLGINTIASTAYHPQTDGQTECINQEIEQYLRLFVNQCQDDWYEWVSLTEFTYNNQSIPPPKQLPSYLTMDNTQGLE